MEVARGVAWGLQADSRDGGRQQMTGSGLHATVLIGRGTLIKTEKCLPPAPIGWRDRSRMRGRMGGRRGVGAAGERDGPLKNVVHMGGLGWGANCVQLSGWLALTESGHWQVRHRWGWLAGTGTSCHSSQRVSRPAPASPLPVKLLAYTKEAKTSGNGNRIHIYFRVIHTSPVSLCKFSLR